MNRRSRCVTFVLGPRLTDPLGMGLDGEIYLDLILGDVKVLAQDPSSGRSWHGVWFTICLAVWFAQIDKGCPSFAAGETCVSTCLEIRHPVPQADCCAFWRRQPSQKGATVSCPRQYIKQCCQHRLTASLFPLFIARSTLPSP